MKIHLSPPVQVDKAACTLALLISWKATVTNKEEESLRDNWEII